MKLGLKKDEITNGKYGQTTTTPLQQALTN